MKNLFLSFCITLVVCSLKSHAQSGNSTQLPSKADTAAKTTINGTIINASTGKPLPYIDIRIPGTGFGTTSNQYGKYEITVNGNHNHIQFSLMGFASQVLSFKLGGTRVINVKMKVADNQLNEVKITSVKRKRYRNKGNPAVELIRKVIAHKMQNQPGNNDYLQYDQYDRIVFSIANLSDKFLNGNFFRRYKFLLDTTLDIDSSKLVKLPVYMSEKNYTYYLRKKPEKNIGILKAHKQINISNLIDSAGLDIYLNRIYGDNIDIYTNNIFVLTNQFLSPIADHSPDFYKFFLGDTVLVGGKKLVTLNFTPRVKGDLLFEGHMLIALDSSYAITSMDMGINKRINLNFIQNFHLHQEFELYPDGRYYLKKNNVKADFGIVKNMKLRFIGERTMFLQHYLVNHPMPDAFYAGKELQDAADSGLKDKRYWEKHRADTLTKKEAGIYTNFDSLNTMPSYKRALWITKTLIGGYADLGPVELGPDEALYSFNNLEGTRLSLGARTTPEFNQNIYLEGYGAYGFTDKVFKYYLNGAYSFNKTPPYKFPNNYLKISYQYDTDIPGINFLIAQTQSLFTSFDRFANKLWLYDRKFRFEYAKDEENHFSYDLAFLNWTQQPADQLVYQSQIQGSSHVNQLTTSEFDLTLRYAPHEQIFQGTEQRHTIPSKYPIFTTQFNFGVKGFANGSYNYQNLTANVYKRFYLSQLGYTDVTFQGGVVLGQVPFPFLSILPANQTYLYDPNTYNMMNFLEFVSDHYASLNITHCFSGFFLNKIPLLDRLNWREYLSLKILYGGLRNENNPAYNLSLYKFPVDASGAPLTFSLGNTPYIEAGVGIGNIFKLIRVDLIRRFNYLDHPNVGAYGLRFSFTPDL
ncbi:DUF5686 family protein [Mucilaginibacter sp.]|uniref:DUF5686 and carboxypeptidase-like regulatory domain-containing protein n=1 Tax=Mucilaginibacter sp. TaxID=1882438 RepID=UPI00283EF85F|nr:DUF5686 family protein [Mucilaginibacter sp.]MDR3696788.1 DUF5686 family protein [Mucilaginibacter sp.]